MRGEVAGCSQPLTAGLAGPTQGSGTEVPPSTGKRVSTGHVETASAQPSPRRGQTVSLSLLPPRPQRAFGSTTQGRGSGSEQSDTQARALPHRTAGPFRGCASNPEAGLPMERAPGGGRRGTEP